MRHVTLPSLLVLLAAVAPARAEEEPAEPAEPAVAERAADLAAPPPDMPEGRDAFLEPGERPNLIEVLGSLRRQIEQFETPPPATPRVTALRDAWDSILEPRIRRMLRRLEKWEDPERWLYVEGEATPVALKPDEWAAFTRDMAGLATELHGAWQQYGSVKIRAKIPHGGIPNPSPPSVYLGYPYAGLYNGILQRQSAGTSLGRWASGSYWRLVDRFRYAWDWSWYRRAYWYEHWQRRIEATEDLFEDLRAELDGTRDILGQALLGLQVYVAALQNAEEERLYDLCESCRTEDETLREMGRTALATMEKERLEAERYQGKSSAAYGSLLRKWLRAQKAALKVMEVAHEDEEPADDE
jgi:hypothetical protein